MDRIDEIRARLDAATPGPSPEFVPVYCACGCGEPVGERLDTREAERNDLIAHAPDDIAWLLDRERRLMSVLSVMTDLAEYDGGGIGRESLDEVLRDYGFSLDEIEANKENNSNG